MGPGRAEPHAAGAGQFSSQGAGAAQHWEQRQGLEACPAGLISLYTSRTARSAHMSQATFRASQFGSAAMALCILATSALWIRRTGLGTALSAADGEEVQQSAMFEVVMEGRDQVGNVPSVCSVYCTVGYSGPQDPSQGATCCLSGNPCSMRTLFDLCRAGCVSGMFRVRHDLGRGLGCMGFGAFGMSIPEVKSTGQAFYVHGCTHRWGRGFSSSETVKYHLSARGKRATGTRGCGSGCQYTLSGQVQWRS
jgi:hypothetical protein